LTATNIKSGSKAIGIQLLSSHACERHFGSSEGFLICRSNKVVDNSNYTLDDKGKYEYLLQNAEDQCKKNTELGDDSDEEHDINDGWN
jgi:hypothetical protein